LKRRLGRWAVTAILMLSLGRPSHAWVTLLDNDKGKLELETRLMFWGVSAGPDDVPSGPAQTEDINDFFVRRARLLLRGQVSPRLQIYLQLGQDNNGSKVLKPDSGFRTKDFYLNYKRAEALQVMVGQFKVPFLRQNLESGFNQLLVDRAALPSLRPAIEGQRDQGGMIWGNRAGFQYRIAVFDGSDQDTTNTRSSFRGAARLSYNWFTPEPGAGYTGTTIGENRILQVGLQGDAQNHRMDSKDDAGFTTLSRDYRAWAADIYFDQPFGGGWALTFEGAWLDRRDDYDGPGVSTRSIKGYYAQGGLLLPGRVGPGRLQLVARYEDLDTERGVVESGNINREVGINYFGKGHDRKIQFDYTQRRESPVDLDNDEYRLSVVAVF
jgi:phosphate-selective porin O/P